MEVALVGWRLPARHDSDFLQSLQIHDLMICLFVPAEKEGLFVIRRPRAARCLAACAPQAAGAPAPRHAPPPGRQAAGRTVPRT
jgi:hypothetical protein